MDSIEIMEKAVVFFEQEIIRSHIRNTKKLVNLKEFSLNPFLDKYKANFLTGNQDPKSIAKALVYPRVLGTSLNTTFGNKLQKFCSEVLDGFASTTSGIDIEFYDKIDGRKKYCQVKAGPNTINADDVVTIRNHFTDIRNLARTNNISISLNDLCVGVFYGEKAELSGHYKKINEEFPVYVGEEFWFRLTGELDFYKRLTNSIGDLAEKADGTKLIDEVIKNLAKQIEKSEF